jgi:hypothetical protein
MRWQREEKSGVFERLIQRLNCDFSATGFAGLAQSCPLRKRRSSRSTYSVKKEKTALMRIEDIKTGDSLQGIEPTALETLIAVIPISTDAIQLVYKTPDGTLKDRLIGRHDVVLDTTRANEVWGWKPKRSFSSILAEIADHAERHPNWL